MGGMTLQSLTFMALKRSHGTRPTITIHTPVPCGARQLRTPHLDGKLFRCTAHHSCYRGRSRKVRSAPTIYFPNSAVKGEIFRVARTVEGRDDIKFLCAGAIIYAVGVVLSIVKKQLGQY